MKKILVILLLIMTGCQEAINNIPLATQGTIVSVTRAYDTTIIKVKYIAMYGNSYDYVNYIGSDTCKVGQTVKLR